MLRIAEGYETLRKQTEERIANELICLDVVLLSRSLTGSLGWGLCPRGTKIQQDCLEELNVLLHLFVHSWRADEPASAIRSRILSLLIVRREKSE